MTLSGFMNFDELLAFHCSPVFVGLKPANLVSLPHGDRVAEQEVDALVAAYNAKFAAQQITFRKLCYCEKRLLILVYNKAELEKILQNAGYQACLVAMGYRKEASLEEQLELLEEHLQRKGAFPHEIGVFLGYPLEDILGFIINGGKNCKYSGYWKVYGDVTAARRLFELYERCSTALLQKVAAGIPLQKAVAMI